MFNVTSFATTENRLHTEWIRFDWDTGHLEIKKEYWDSLSKKKKSLILDMMKEETEE